MINNNISTYEDLQSYFMNKVVTYLISKNTKPIVWEEAFLNGVELQNFSAIVQVWRDWTEDALLSVGIKNLKQTSLRKLRSNAANDL